MEKNKNQNNKEEEKEVAFQDLYTLSQEIMKEDEKKEKEAIVLFGKTQLGKSSYANFLLGLNFETKEDKEGLFFIDPSQALFKIGDDMASQTTEPKMGKNPKNDLTVWDFPGIIDTKGKMSNLRNALLIMKVIQNLEKIKIGLFIPKSDFDNASIAVEAFFDNMAQWFGEKVSLIKYGLFLVITKCDGFKKKDSFIIKISLPKRFDKLLERHKDDKNYQELVKYFIENMASSIIFFPKDVEDQEKRRTNDIELLKKLKFIETNLLDFTNYDDAHFPKKFFSEEEKRLIKEINQEITFLKTKIDQKPNLVVNSFSMLEKKNEIFKKNWNLGGSIILEQFSALFTDVNLSNQAENFKKSSDQLNLLRKFSRIIQDPMCLLTDALSSCYERMVLSKVDNVYVKEEKTLMIISEYGNSRELMNKGYDQYIEKLPGLQIDSVILYVKKSLFFNEDIILRGINLFIYCQQCIVEENKKIDLSGINASNIDDISKPGKDGKPGRPGGNAGSLFFEYQSIYNIEGLKIIVNGGNGGKGGKGGDSSKGNNELSKADEIRFEENDPKFLLSGEKIPTSKWRTHMSANELYYFIYEARHEPSNIPGKRGCGGKGGFPGYITINSIQSHNLGIRGDDGVNGELGDQGHVAFLLKKRIKSEKFLPIFRKLTHDKTLIIKQMISFFDDVEKMEFQKYIENDSEIENIRSMKAIIEKHIDDATLQKKYQFKATKEDGLTPYLFKELYTENLIRYSLIETFLRIVIAKNWVNSADLLHLLTNKKLDFSLPLNKLRSLISLMNVIVYLKYYTEFKENFTIFQELQKIIEIQKNNLKNFKEIEFKKSNNYHMSYFLEKMMNEYERKKSENKDLKDKREKEELKNTLGKDNKKKLSKVLKEFEKSEDLPLLKILGEAKFFSLIHDYDIGVMASPPFLEEYFEDLFWSFDLRNILDGQRFNFPRWSFDLNILKIFLIFALGLKDEKNVENLKHEDILEKLETLLNNQNASDSNDFGNLTAIHLLGAEQLANKITHFIVFYSATYTAGIAAAAIAEATAEAAFVGFGAMVGGIVTGSLMAAQLLGSWIGALANENSETKKYEINDKPRSGVNEREIQIPQEIPYQDFCQLNERLKLLKNK